MTVVETSGALVGAIGPGQLAGRDRRRAGQRCSGLMVAISSVLLLPASTPASDLPPALGRHGFALVRVSDGLAYVEAADLLEQIQAAITRSQGSRDPIAYDSSESLDERQRANHEDH